MTSIYERLSKDFKQQGTGFFIKYLIEKTQNYLDAAPRDIDTNNGRATLDMYNESLFNKLATSDRFIVTMMKDFAEYQYGNVSFGKREFLSSRITEKEEQELLMIVRPVLDDYVRTHTHTLT